MSERKIEEMNIFEKMSAITTELGTVAKNLNVPTTKTASYKAVSERDIIDAVKPIESQYRVYSYPCSRNIIESNLIESESEYNGKVTKKTTFMTRIETVYRFVNMDKPDEYIETTTYAEGIDTQDKGSGKAMTYADKYALMKAYKISTGEDPDQTASQEIHYTKAKKTIDEVAPNTIKDDINDVVNKLSMKLNEEAETIKRNALKELGVSGKTEADLKMIYAYLKGKLLNE